MFGGEPLEQAGDGAKLAFAAVAGQDAKEVGGGRVEGELLGYSAERLPRILAADQRTVDQLREFARIGERLDQRIETAADRVDLPLVTGEPEQRSRVAPC